MPRVVVTVDGKTWLDAEVVEAELDRQNDWVEIRRDPLLAAAFAGADPEATLGISDIEKVQHLHTGTRVTLRTVFTLPGTGKLL